MGFRVYDVGFEVQGLDSVLQQRAWDFSGQACFDLKSNVRPEVARELHRGTLVGLCFGVGSGLWGGLLATIRFGF